jgi:hypothetical protein
MTVAQTKVCTTALLRLEERVESLTTKQVLVILIGFLKQDGEYCYQGALGTYRQ